MDAFGRENYDDFYVAYFNSRGEMIFPTDSKEVDIINKLLKGQTNSSLIYTNDKNYCFKVRIKRKVINEEKIQIIELSNVTEFFNQISNASVDEVTHLGNRKIARNQFVQYIEKAYKNDEDFSIILADLDGFKLINDTYGHINGDTVLSEVSRVLYCSTRQENYREQDTVARIGGDEFIIIMKNISEEVSLKRAEKIRCDVENYQVELFSETGEISHIKTGTLSMGLYHVTNQTLVDFYNKGYTTDEIRQTLFDRCDSALYSSKNNGKNRVTIYKKGQTRLLK